MILFDTSVPMGLVAMAARYNMTFLENNGNNKSRPLQWERIASLQHHSPVLSSHLFLMMMLKLAFVLSQTTPPTTLSKDVIKNLLLLIIKNLLLLTIQE